MRAVTRHNVRNYKAAPRAFTHDGRPSEGQTGLAPQAMTVQNKTLTNDKLTEPTGQTEIQLHFSMHIHSRYGLTRSKRPKVSNIERSAT